MKKVLVLNYEFPPLGGGAGNATYYLLKEFSKNPDLQIDLVTSSLDGFRTEQFADNVTIHFLDIGKKGNLHYQSNKNLLVYAWKAYFYSKKLIKGKQFDLVHAFFGIPCGYVAMKLGLPYIVSLRGSDVPFYNNRFYWLDTLIFKRLSKKIWKNAEAVIANSDGLKDLALSSVPTQSISVIPNGIDIEEFKPSTTPRQGKFTLISTGRLIERKGYEYLLEAMRGIADIRLILIGDGNRKAELEAKAKENGLDVTFLGARKHEEIPALLQSADVFVLPSLNEGMSNSILEAMAAGLPIITTDTGGSSELIKENGIIVAKANDLELRDAIVALKSDDQKLQKMGMTSRLLAEQNSWKHTAEAYVAEYNKI